MYELGQVIFVGIIGLLVGVASTSLAFMVSFTSRLTKTETQQDNLSKEVRNVCDAVAKHLEANTRVCPVHTEIVDQISRYDERIKNLETRS